ncbi:hypothetical protein HYS99_01030 [Candidatus Giovannonibacteria bacterium]|nr:hypothetical protein [Candidatus Giovannonibacteria bacterium]
MAKRSEATKIGSVISIYLRPKRDENSFVTVMNFGDLNRFRVGATFKIGETLVRTTEENATAEGLKKPEFSLKDFGTMTKVPVFFLNGSPIDQIKCGDKITVV